MKLFFKQMIRDDYDNYADEVVARTNKPAGGSRSAKGSSSNILDHIDLSFSMPPPLAESRSTSLQESFELAQRLEAEEAAREEEEVKMLAALLEAEDRQVLAVQQEVEEGVVKELALRLKDEDRAKAELFYCEICMDSDAAIHGAITLDCDHRFCEGR
jgi:hypothetical protein